ncbi:MAG TPA: prepilin peptidase [Sphingomicrobium sp.]
MNLIQNSPTWLVILLFAALVAAAFEDFIRLKISNFTCLAVLVTALIAMGLNGFPLALWQNALVFLVLFGAGIPLFATGKMGGGDVKLLACLGLWVNIVSGVWLLASTLVAGGILALIYIAIRVARGVRLGKKYQSKGIPYGIAIAAGASLIFAGQFGLLTPKPQRPNPLAIPTDIAG